MLMRFDPLRDINRLSQFFQQGSAAQLMMPMDAYRDGDQLVVHFDVPGVDPDSIDVTIEKNVVTVRAERRWQKRDDQDVLISERPQGSFVRQLFLGERLDAEHVQADDFNGVLTLRIPVMKEPEPKRVAVESAEPGEQRPGSAAQGGQSS
jgi:HSP20 family protein